MRLAAPPLSTVLALALAAPACHPASAPEAPPAAVIVLEGRALQIRHDGSVHPYGPERTTPAANVTFFRPQLARRFDRPLEQAEFEARLDALALERNRFVAIRVTGTFAVVRTRSAPPPPRPYSELAEALSKQVEFEFQETKGTFVGADGLLRNDGELVVIRNYAAEHTPGEEPRVTGGAVVLSSSDDWETTRVVTYGTGDALSVPTTAVVRGNRVWAMKFPYDEFFADPKTAARREIILSPLRFEPTNSPNLSRSAR